LVDVIKDVFGREAYDLHAVVFENACSPFVLSPSVSMDGAVDFDGEL